LAQAQVSRLLVAAAPDNEGIFLRRAMKSVMYLCLLFLLPLALHADVSRQGVFSMEPDSKAEKDEPAVVRVENHVRKHVQKIMIAIDRYRAEVCYNMKGKFGIDFKTFKACHRFMKKACNPGEDMVMNGEEGEVSSGKGYCRKYFSGEQEKHMCDLMNGDKEKCQSSGCKWDGSTCKPKCRSLRTSEICESSSCSWDGSKCKASPGPAQAPVTAPPSAVASTPAPAPAAAKASGPAEAAAKAGGAAAAPAKAGGAVPAGGAGLAPAPGPQLASSPGPAPVPAPFIPGVSGGKPWGPIEDNEAWYYKKGGQDIGRMHMDAGLGLPTHGYWGKLVEHVDGETSTEDWQLEFGPKAGHSSLGSICKEHPDNAWCRVQAYGRHFRSSCLAGASPLLALVVLLLPAVMVQ